MSITTKAVLVAFVLLVLSPFYYPYVLRFGSSSWTWFKNLGEDSEYPPYESYGIRIPRKYSIHGIDVSYYQGKIDWQKVKAMNEEGVTITFAFIKATEGLLLVDRYFQRNWREAPKAGVLCGAYHFFRPRKSGKWQAKFFLKTVGFEKGDLRPVVDVEELNGVSPTKMRKELKAFVDHVEEKIGVKPIIYTGLSFYKDYLANHFKDYPLWIAHYYQSRLRVNKATPWFFWQHSDKARVNGINHVVDMNVFNGSIDDFEEMIVK